jgi:hypothetical protein
MRGISMENSLSAQVALALVAKYENGPVGKETEDPSVRTRPVEKEVGIIASASAQPTVGTKSRMESNRLRAASYLLSRAG